MSPLLGIDGPAPMGELLERAAGLIDVDPRSCSVSGLREAVLLHAELAGRLEAEAARFFGAFDAAGVAGYDGARTTRAWLAARTELDRAHASALVLRGRELVECPHLAAAYADGRLGSAKVRALLAARRAHPELFAEHEEELVGSLEPLTVAHAKIAAAHWHRMAEATKAHQDEAAAAETEREAASSSAGSSGAAGPAGPRAGAGADGSGGGAGAADGSPDAFDGGAADGGVPDGGVPDRGDGVPDLGAGPTCAPASDPAPDPAMANRLHLSQTFQGRWMLEGDLDPVSGAELSEAIAAFIDARFHEGTWSKDDGLTAGYRRAHALVALIGRGAVAATRHGDPRPSVVVRIDPATLAGLPADSLLAGFERECCLDDGTPVEPRAIERLLCTARVQALWTRLRADGTVETLGVTDLLRDATRAQRRALKQRDGRCAFPGCDAAAEWCEAHHLVPHEDLGPTLLHNLVLLCRFHHHLVHEGGWTLWRDEDGELHLVDPQHRPRPITLPGHKQPSFDPDVLPLRHPPPAPPHLHPPRFRTAHDPPSPRPPLGRDDPPELRPTG